MHPACSRHRDRTQRSAFPYGPGQRPHADVPGVRKAVPSRTPCRSSCSGAAGWHLARAQRHAAS
eukprot:12863102-Alexandrium_andersonii.AAC.1